MNHRQLRDKKLATFEIDPQVWETFKQKCAAQGKNASAVLVDFVASFNPSVSLEEEIINHLEKYLDTHLDRNLDQALARYLDSRYINGDLDRLIINNVQSLLDRKQELEAAAQIEQAVNKLKELEKENSSEEFPHLEPHLEPSLDEERPKVLIPDPGTFEYTLQFLRETADSNKMDRLTGGGHPRSKRDVLAKLQFSRCYPSPDGQDWTLKKLNQVLREKGIKLS